MRIWSIHPKHLDTKGLVALWRETLLAAHVLQGRTKGYKNHPQLNRFKECVYPLHAINQYLANVYYEAERRGFHFDPAKIEWDYQEVSIPVTYGQIAFERAHLLTKLQIRDKMKYSEILLLAVLEVHPLFTVVCGNVESWEKQ